MLGPLTPDVGSGLESARLSLVRSDGFLAPDHLRVCEVEPGSADRFRGSDASPGECWWSCCRGAGGAATILIPGATATSFSITARSASVG